jgi:hypothetical protein
MLVRRLEILGHAGLEIIIAVVGVAAAWLFRMGVDVDGDKVVRIEQFHVPRLPHFHHYRWRLL